MFEISQVICAIEEKRKARSPEQAILVGISGIDASGKGYLTAKLDERLRSAGWNTAAISADDWLTLPDVCIDPERPAERFYEAALRCDEMFDQLITPLRRDRRIDVIANCGDAKTTVHREHRYFFNDIDIVLLEGIFLFKIAYRDQFDLKVWVDCSFETALERAIARGQEGLNPLATRQAFETIYFPAQRLHFQKDHPRKAADHLLRNDRRNAL